jgi:hypothetical protein
VLGVGYLYLVVMQLYNASTQVVDTHMLGTITVEIQLAPAKILMLKADQAAAGLLIIHPQKLKLGEMLLVLILVVVVQRWQLKLKITH